MSYRGIKVVVSSWRGRVEPSIASSTERGGTHASTLAVHRVLEAEVTHHGVIGGDKVEVGNTLGPDGALMGGHNFVLNSEAVGVLQP